MGTPPGAPVQASFRTSRIIHAALVGSLGIHAIVVHVMRTMVRRPTGLDDPVVEGLRLAFFVLAGALALAVLLLRARWLTADPPAPSLAELQTRLIICLALAESIAILGLILAIASWSLRDFYALWIPALGLQLLLTPSRAVWDAAGRRRGVRSR